MGSPAADKALHNSFPSPGVPSRDRPFLNVHQFLFASYFVTLSEQKKKSGYPQPRFKLFEGKYL
jgi:hypothetical protein